MGGSSPPAAPAPCHVDGQPGWAGHHCRHYMINRATFGRHQSNYISNEPTRRTSLFRGVHFIPGTNRQTTHLLGEGMQWGEGVHCFCLILKNNWLPDGLILFFCVIFPSLPGTHLNVMPWVDVKPPHSNERIRRRRGDSRANIYVLPPWAVRHE